MELVSLPQSHSKRLNAIEIRGARAFCFYEVFCSANDLTSNSLSAIPSWSKPRTTRGFALRAPDCAFPHSPEKVVSKAFCLKTS